MPIKFLKKNLFLKTGDKIKNSANNARCEGVKKYNVSFAYLHKTTHIKNKKLTQKTTKDFTIRKTKINRIIIWKRSRKNTKIVRKIQKSLEKIQLLLWNIHSSLIAHQEIAMR